MTVTVATQAELDAAVAASEPHIVINSPAGVWLALRSDPAKSRVEAWESSRVEAWESSRVEARGSSRVEAWGSSSVEARGSSRVEARESSRVEAWESSRVEAWESSRVVARGSSRVEAWGSSSVEARESSSVEAWESSSVEAWESSRVEAWESSSVVAGSHVAVHLHSAQATISGGVVIDITALDLDDAATWLAYHGVTVVDGKAVVYKAVNADLIAGHGRTLTRYPIGETVTAPDWDDARSCGRGLHFGASPSHARVYYGGSGAPRFLACEVAAETLIPLYDKLKAPSCRVLHEVDIHGDRIDSEAGAA